MKRNFNHMVIPVMLILATLLAVGCNTENEGIFMRISESVEKVDVGSIHLISRASGNLFSYTSKASLQVYDPTTKNWESIPAAGVRHFTFDGTDIVYATEATYPDDNTLYTYDIGTKTHTTWTAEHAVKAMSPQFNLMLLRDGVDNFSVYSADADPLGSSKASFTTQFVDEFPPNLIAFDDTTFLVSGNSASDTTKFSHYYVSGGATDPMTSTTDATFDDNPLVAMAVAGTDIIVIDSLGKVWKATTGTFSAFTSTSSITGFPERNPKNLPYPVFYHGGSLYLQNGDNDFYAVDVTSGAVSEVTLDFADTFSNIKIKSYLVVLDTVYVGTMENGIYTINMLDGTATDI